METGSIPGSVFTAPRDSTVTYKTAAEHGTLNKDDFMRLFITQLQYQDPMAPMDSADMSSQVAQFNMVDLMYKSNEAMETLVNAQNTATNMSAVTMVGHHVHYQGNTIEVSDDGPGFFNIETDLPVTSCNVVIKNLQGEIVASWDRGFLPSGTNALEWDGLDMNGDDVDPGAYTVYIRAVDAQGDDIKVRTVTRGSVVGVSYDTDGNPELSMQDGTRTGMENIRLVEA